MVILYFKKQFILIFFLLLFITCPIVIWYRLYQPVVTDTYRLRPEFPPLILLPGSDQGPKVYATAAILIESKSGAILYAKNADLRRAPASTTKIMTTIVALEKGDLNKIITVSPRAARTGGSTIHLKPGDRLSLKELLEGVMLRSGNDGSMAVAEGVAGSIQNFTELMNLKAKEIGAVNTNFRNPHGLRAPSHYTTALDLALMARYGLANRFFANLVKKKTALLEWEERRKSVEVRNTNRLLWYLEGADGVKTGTTNEAGHCLVASATRDYKQLIAVVLNSRDRWGDSQRLLEYGFQEFDILKIAAANRVVAKIKVKKGWPRNVNLYPRSDLVAVVRKGEIKMVAPKIRIFKNPVSAPLKPGQILGDIGYQYREQLVNKVDLINLKPVRKSWWFW
ncbi:MAG: D-alanyl-D-alanine carboxypeptidase family protein [Bacteroidota bacterium]